MCGSAYERIACEMQLLVLLVNFCNKTNKQDNVCSTCQVSLISRAKQQRNEFCILITLFAQISGFCSVWWSLGHAGWFMKIFIRLLWRPHPIRGFQLIIGLLFSLKSDYHRNRMIFHSWGYKRIMQWRLARSISTLPQVIEFEDCMISSHKINR